MHHVSEKEKKKNNTTTHICAIVKSNLEVSPSKNVLRLQDCRGANTNTAKINNNLTLLYVTGESAVWCCNDVKGQSSTGA